MASIQCQKCGCNNELTNVKCKSCGTILRTEKTDPYKIANGKPPYELLPPECEEDLLSIFAYGAAKYEPNSWQKIQDPYNALYAAARRHMAAWRKGEKLDTESGLHHLAHAAWSLLILIRREAIDNENK